MTGCIFLFTGRWAYNRGGGGGGGKVITGILRYDVFITSVFSSCSSSLLLPRAPFGLVACTCVMLVCSF